LEVDNGFGLLELAFKPTVFLFEFEQTETGRGGRLVFARCVGDLQGTRRPLTAKAGESGMSEPRSSKQLTELTRLGAGVGFLQDLEFVGAGIAVSKLGRAGDDLGIGRAESFLLRASREFLRRG